MSRVITQNVSIIRAPEDIFKALINPSAIKAWWQAQTAIVVPAVNGIYAASWGEDIDDADYITVSTITEITSNSSLSLEYVSYYAKEEQLPFDAKMNVLFTIRPMTETETMLIVKQTGIPDDPIADDYFDGCTKGWTQVLSNIKAYCERD